MPLTTYTAGEVLTASSLNANLSFAASGLVRVGGGSLSSNSTAFTNVFSADYHAYKIVVSNAGIASSDYFRIILGATATGYVQGMSGVTVATSAYSNTFSGVTTSFLVAYSTATIADLGFEFTLINPQLAKKTFISSTGNFNTATENGSMGGYLNNSTQYTGLTFSTPAASFTGTVNIYGYSLS